MSKHSITLSKSKEFAIRIVRLSKYLTSEKHEFVISKQLLRSGTAVGANLSEAIYGVSLKDFVSKIYISLKECAETKYWLELLFETEFLTETEFNSIYKD